MDQQLTFDVQLVANESGCLFAQGGASLPALFPNGTLTFRLAPFVHGSFEMSVVLRDDGGGDFGGVDVSTAQIVHVSILPVNSQPSFALDMPLVTVDECPRADDGFLDDSCCVNE